jgi:hypothetical protein
MIREITANNRSRWMSRPAVLNMKKPPSHITTRTIASMSHMGNPAFSIQKKSRAEGEPSSSERDRQEIKLPDILTTPGEFPRDNAAARGGIY